MAKQAYNPKLEYVEEVEMDAAEIRSKVKQVIYHVTNIAPDRIGDDRSFRDDLGLDSLSLMEIGVDVDYEFQLGLPDEALRGLDSVDETVALVERRLAEKAEKSEAAEAPARSAVA